MNEVRPPSLRARYEEIVRVFRIEINVRRRVDDVRPEWQPVANFKRNHYVG